MSIIKIKNVIQRVFKMTWDMDYIQNAIYNDKTGAQKGLAVEPVVTGPYVANTAVSFGSYIKIAAGITAYGVDCVGKAFDIAYDKYRRGDLVTDGGFVWIANQDIEHAHAFDIGEWTKVAPKTITGIPVAGGQMVCVGRYHNAISVAGFTVDDETSYRKVE